MKKLIERLEEEKVIERPVMHVDAANLVQKIGLTDVDGEQYHSIMAANHSKEPLYFEKTNVQLIFKHGEYVLIGKPEEVAKILRRIGVSRI